MFFVRGHWSSHLFKGGRLWDEKNFKQIQSPFVAWILKYCQIYWFIFPTIEEFHFWIRLDLRMDGINASLSSILHLYVPRCRCVHIFDKTTSNCRSNFKEFCSEQAREDSKYTGQMIRMGKISKELGKKWEITLGHLYKDPRTVFEVRSKSLRNLIRFQIEPLSEFTLKRQN